MAPRPVPDRVLVQTDALLDVGIEDGPFHARFRQRGRDIAPAEQSRLQDLAAKRIDPDLKRFRRSAGFTACDEGWALQAGTLGFDPGQAQACRVGEPKIIELRDGDACAGLRARAALGGGRRRAWTIAWMHVTDVSSRLRRVAQTRSASPAGRAP